jgi:hypothetical protein
MPIGDLHKRKFKTNMAILLVVFAWIALIWVVAMVKMGGG